MIRKILTHLSSLPPRTNLYANLHFIMPPHNMVIAVMFSRERGGHERKKLSCGSITEACALVRLHTRASPRPRCSHVENTVNFRQNRKCVLKLRCFKMALCNMVYVYWLQTAAF